MDDSVKVAIIGCGWAGQRHARAWRELGAAVRWAVDVEPSRHAAVKALAPAARTGDDYRAALADPAVTAVDICLPHYLHAPVAVAAARAGKHILCEKPIAGTLAEADAMIEAAAAAGVSLMIAENVHFDPLYARVRDLLRAGVIGRPALVQRTREAYLTRSFLAERRWFLDARAAAGGIMMAGGVHDLELLRLLIGEIDQIQALRARQRFQEMEGDDTSIALLRFADGTVGTLVESFVIKSLSTAAGSELHTLRIDGDHGSLRVNDDQTVTIFSERPEYTYGDTPTQHQIYVPATDTFRLEIEHFCQSLRTGVEPLTSGRSQRRPLELVLAAYRAMETGQAVRC
jgi:predicted dehydrogenase